MFCLLSVLRRSSQIDALGNTLSDIRKTFFHSASGQLVPKMTSRLGQRPMQRQSFGYFSADAPNFINLAGLLPEKLRAWKESVTERK
jgi:hypothetical protein